MADFILAWFFSAATQRHLQQREGPQSDDAIASYAETQGLLNTLYINLILFTFFMTFFEVNRHMRSTYLKRVTKRFQRCNRVPAAPSNFPFAWIMTVLDVEEEDFLRMVGLDGYMLMRYINVCFRMSVFFTIWGLMALVPVYGHAPGRHVGWNKYTLANIPNNPKADQLWVPAIFAYVFSIYFCHLMYTGMAIATALSLIQALPCPYPTYLSLNLPHHKHCFFFRVQKFRKKTCSIFDSR